MDSTFVAFVPSALGPFSFSPVIAGVTYNAEIDYNAFGQRFYLNLTTLTSAPVLYTALVETGPSFQAALTWSLGVATVTLQKPHNVPIGQQVRARISQTESGFDGFPILMLAVNAETLTFQLPADPEAQSAQGVLSMDINMVEGILADGLLVYHDGLQQFEFA